MINFNQIKKLVEERDRFLSEHPELQPLQDEINLLLSKAANTQDRNRIIQEMLLNTWFKITKI